MRSAIVAPDNVRIRWMEIAGPPVTTVYLHGLGAAAVPYFLDVALHRNMALRRSLFIDLLGCGLSDRPESFSYTLVNHARAVAGALDTARVRDVNVVGHSLGGSVAIVLAYERPDLVGRLVIAEPNLLPWDGDVSVGIARQEEDAFVDHGFDELVARSDPDWVATLRMADPCALHRTAVGLCHGSHPAMHTMLCSVMIPRTLLYGSQSTPPPESGRLRKAGVSLVEVRRAGHIMMKDNLDGFVSSIASTLATSANP
ncbi:MAG: alpha/beta hydrolase [Actinomycetota bacterium]|nr:alpha/beta hydrolase [Actinomycetota bacterium]